MRMLYRYSFLFAWLQCFLPIFLEAETIIYPAGVDVIDVTAAPWYVDNTGTADVTAKLNEIFQYYCTDGAGPHRIIYFPDGTYRVSNLIFSTDKNDLTAQGGLNIQGQSREGVIIRLKDNTAGASYTDAAGEYVTSTGNFSDVNSPLPVISFFEGNATNNAFYNSIENITIDVGSGNPGAIGLRFFDNNTGYIRNVLIKSSDTQYVGAVGLDLSQPLNGQGTIQRLEVIGFDYGIDLADNDGHPWAMEHITLKHQRIAGIRNDMRMLPIRQLTSVNSVPAIVHTDVFDHGQGGMIVLLDSHLSGGIPVNSAIKVEDGYLYLRNVTHTGYNAVADYKGALVTGDYSNSEYISGPSVRNWGSTPMASLNLPIVETPEVPWDDPADWSILEARGGGLDDTENIRAAMESGKTTVYFKKGNYRISETITIGKNVRRMMGQWSDISMTLPLRGTENPVFVFNESNHPVVLIERFKTGFGFLDPAPYMIQNNSSSDLILRDIFWVASPIYRNQPNGGRLFVEDVHTLPGTQTNIDERPAWVINQQDAWFRGVNPEMQTPHIVNDGGSVWIFGGKFGEQMGPVVKTLNFGRTEILGALQNVTHDTGPDDPNAPAILWSENGHVSAILVERARNGWGYHPIVAREIRGNETRELVHADFPERNGDWNDTGVIVPFYAGYLDPSTVGNLAPIVSAASALSTVFPNPLPLTASASDDGVPLPVLKTSWKKISGPGNVSFDDFSAVSTYAHFSRPGEYILRVTANDGIAASHRDVNVSITMGNMSLAAAANATLTDDAPQDGIAEAITSQEIRVGDGNSNQEQIAFLDFEIRSLEGQNTEIEEALLRLTLQQVTGSVATLEIYHLETGHGQHQKTDLGIAGTLIQTLDVSGKSINENLYFDITQALKSDIQAGKAYSNYRIEVQNISTDWQGDNLVFYDKNDAEDYRPMIEISADANAPSNLSVLADAVNHDEIHLSWQDHATTEAHYWIEQRKDGETWVALPALPANSTLFTVTALDDATTYFFRVRVELADGTFSSYSNTAAATTIANAPPLAPSTLSADAISTNQINLYWTDNADNEMTYVLERKEGTGAWILRATLPHNTVNFVDTAVQNDTPYEYRIYAQNTAGVSTTLGPVSVSTPAIDSMDPDLLHLKFDETSGTLASDSSGNGLDFNLQNINFTDDSFAAESPPNRALRFTDWDNMSRDDFSYGPDFTLSIWFKIEDGNVGNNLRYLFSHGDETNDSQYLHVAIGENDSFSYPQKLVTRLKDSEDIQNDEVLNIPLSSFSGDNGQWHLYTLTVSSGGTTHSRVYVDGVELATSSQGGASFDPLIDNSTYKVRVGMRSRFSSMSSFQGAIDDVRMFSRALSNDEIQRLWDLGPSGVGKAPNRPTGLWVSNVTDSQVTVQWQHEGETETGFEIQRDAGAGWQTLQTVAENTFSYQDSSVSANHAYQYRVRAKSGVGDSEWSQTVVTYTQQNSQSIPGPWQAIDLGSVEIPGSESYSTDSGGIFSVVSSGETLSSNADSARFVYRPMTGDGEFILEVPSFSSTGTYKHHAGIMLRESLDAGARTLIPHLAKDGRINFYRRTSTNSSTTTGLADNANSRWFRLVRSGDVFTAYHSSDGNTWNLFTGTNVENPVTLTSMPATLYVGMVVSAGGEATGGGGYIGNAQFKNIYLTAQPPEAPIGLSATANGTSSIELSWTDFSDNETAFKIERKAGLAGIWTEVTGGLPTNSISYSDTAVAPFTTYYYRIWAESAVGDSPKSEQAFASTGAAPPPTDPSNLSVQTGVAGALELSWTDAENESEYRIERKRGSSGLWTELAVSVPGGVTSFEDTGLDAGTLYYYRVKAKNPSGESAFTNEASATTQSIATRHLASDLTWYRGRTSSGSTLTQTSETLTLFSGTSGGNELHTNLLAYFNPLTLADRETLRLRFDMRFDGTVPDIGQSVRFGLVDSQGTRFEANTTGNNPAERRNDRGYGIALASGSATNTRYIEEAGANMANNPFIYDFTIVGADPSTYGINDQSTHTVVLDLVRQGTSLKVNVYFEGSSIPYNNGRTLAVPETFTYDCVVFDARNQNTTLVIENLRIEHYSDYTPSPVESWRITHFGDASDSGFGANLADPDTDGLENLLEYALGTDPNAQDANGVIVPSLQTVADSSYLTLAFKRNQNASDLNWIIEKSDNLSDWHSVWDHAAGDPTYVVNTVDHGDSTETLSIRHTDPIQGSDKQFLRLRVVLLD